MNRCSIPLMLLSGLAFVASASPVPAADAPATRPAASSQAASRPAPRQRYGLTAQDTRIVLLLQRSGSMVDDIGFVHGAAAEILWGLGPDQQFAVLSFAQDVTPIAGAVLTKATPAAIQRATAILAEHQVAKGRAAGLLTPFQNAFEKALALRPTTIVLISAGDFDPALAGAVIPKAKGVRIHTVCVGGPLPNQMLMRDLASLAGGTLTSLPKAGPLPPEDADNKPSLATPALLDQPTPLITPLMPPEVQAAPDQIAVGLEVLVQADGTVKAAKVTKSSGWPQVDTAFVAAVSKCHFRPACADGKPVAKACALTLRGRAPSHR